MTSSHFTPDFAGAPSLGGHRPLRSCFLALLAGLLCIAFAGCKAGGAGDGTARTNETSGVTGTMAPHNEFILVIFPTERTVLINGEPRGVTNEMIPVPRGVRAISLAGPLDYEPEEQMLPIEGTSLMAPLQIMFFHSGSTKDGADQ